MNKFEATVVVCVFPSGNIIPAHLTVGGGKFEEKNQDLVEIFYSARILQYYHYLEIEKMVQNDMIKMQLSK